MEPPKTHNAYQAYLEEKHSQFNTPIELIDQEVKKPRDQLSQLKTN